MTEEAKPSSQSSPLLYDLTTLQREANSRFGFSAKTTLSLAQALYEKHKVLTYPRTDSRYLPEDYLPTVKSTFEMIAGEDLPGPLRELAPQAQWVSVGKRGFAQATAQEAINALLLQHCALGLAGRA